MDKKVRILFSICCILLTILLIIGLGFSFIYSNKYFYEHDERIYYKEQMGIILGLLLYTGICLTSCVFTYYVIKKTLIVIKDK